MKNFEYAMPSTVDKIKDYLGENTRIKAGGVDLLDMMKEGLIAPERLVNIRQLEELHFIEHNEEGGLRIGPNVTLAELGESSHLNGGYMALAQAAAGAATPQIRNMATLAGNLCQRPRCWYFRSSDFNCTRKGGDTCFAQEGENQFHAILGNQDGCVIVHPSATAVALVSLDAMLELTGREGKRRLSVAEFFVPPAQDIQQETILEPDEIITAIEIPDRGKNWFSHYEKLMQKQAFDWPLSEAAVSLQLDGRMVKKAHICLGSVAPVPWRAKVAESVLKNSEITEKLAMSAADEELESAEPLSLNEYKIQISRTILYRAICSAAGIEPKA